MPINPALTRPALHSAAMRLCSILTLSAALFAAPAWSWGNEGHEIVATIAQIHLLPSAEIAVRGILPQAFNGSLASVATWPDEVRKHPAWNWSAQYHFVNGKDDLPPQDCAFGKHGWISDKNILNGIVDATRNLTHFTGRAQDYALRFLTHFLGDVHQPLHLTGSFFGANLVPVIYEGKNTSLHSAWDDDLVLHRIRTLTNYTTRLPTSPTPSLPPSTVLRNKRIESALTGSNYDPLVRWIVLEGIDRWWADKVKDWATCPQWDVRDCNGQTVMDKLPFEDPLDVPVCPYHWSVPTHQMLCDFVWRPEFKGVKRAKDAVYEIEIETPEYAGRVRDEKMIERQFALGGIRLAATINTVLGSEAERRAFGVFPVLF
ncbi:S1/P1 nuclease [Ceratobasidium sp. AG-Ba]|nr:S1/P1 nuclease [Ceratobasidium sp. AG-Ba]